MIPWVIQTLSKCAYTSKHDYIYTIALFHNDVEEDSVADDDSHIGFQVQGQIKINLRR